MRPIEALTPEERRLYSQYIRRSIAKLPITPEMRAAKNLYGRVQSKLCVNRPKIK